ncbi:helix-turn-helix domain-containing protein [Tomitella gaofuii]|uniref:helix-turn-helix domain-containing protein n=1 Tax=Tomitella gaofuii TaxID=2760083 RepID=UPI0015FB3B51|nr:helix-turn-helix domain-containing protein [Tomitella gaofuii]
MVGSHDPADGERSEGGSGAPESQDRPTQGASGSAAPFADQLGDGAGEIAEKVVNTAQDIGGFIRSQRESAQVSLRQLAERAGVSNPYLSQIERGLRRPSAEVLGQIAKGLRVSAEALYIRAGILEQRDPSPVRDAVLSDPALSERQRQVILEIYDSFCRENVGAAAHVADSAQ